MTISPPEKKHGADKTPPAAEKSGVPRKAQETTAKSVVAENTARTPVKNSKEASRPRGSLLESLKSRISNEDGVDEEETLAPLPNILDMISNSMKGEKSVQATSKKATVTRVSSFKEPDAPPNSVERLDRLSPVSREERALLDYDDDDFLAVSGDTEDIELF